MTDKNKKHDVAIDSEGKVLTHKPEEVREILADMLEEGKLIAVVIEAPDGSVGVQVLGPPNEALVSILDAAARAYKKAFFNSLGKAH